jgi:ParB-like chromosome segregation protein Spo0J
MSLAKVYPLDVEAGVERLVFEMNELREKARATLENARFEYDQMRLLQAPATKGRKQKKAEKDAKKLWDDVEAKLEDAFEDLEEALLLIRKPFRK